MKKSNKRILRIVMVSSGVTLLGAAWLMMMGNFMNAAGAFCADIANSDSVSVNFDDSDRADAFSSYNNIADVVHVVDWSDETIAHELKHAHNAVVFRTKLSAAQNEISARCASVLVWLEANGRARQNAQPKFERHAMLPRDVKYDIPDLSRAEIDCCLNVALADWDVAQHLYIDQRISSIFYTSMIPMSDADLARLFTFKINGQDCSLYRECSPSVRSAVRDACNAENFVYWLQHKNQRTR